MEELIKELGFLCYNTYVDGNVNNPKLIKGAESVRFALSFLANSSIDSYAEEELNDKINDLGMLCYNLYVEGVLDDDIFIPLCESINSVNNRNSAFEHESFDDFKNKDESFFDLGEVFGSENEGESEGFASFEELEPIPGNFKECECGYKNIEPANYCGKCGKKLV